MSKPIHALIVEDSADDALILVRELRRGGYEPTSERVETAETMREALRRRTPDVILSDHAMPHFSAPAALEVLRESGLDVPFIIVSGVLGEELAVRLMKEGADDYIPKTNLTRLVPGVEREIGDALGRRERRRVEEALRVSEEHYRSLVETTLDIVTVLTLDGTILYENPALQAHTGFQPEELVDRNLLDFVHPDDRGAVTEAIRVCGEGTQPVMLAEYRFRHADGSWVEFDSRGMLYQEQGQKRLLVNSRNVTARKLMESRLLRVNRSLRATSRCNQALVRATDEKNLLDTVCRIVVEDAGFGFCWAGFLHGGESGVITPVAHCGTGASYLEHLRIDLKDERRARGPTATAVRTGEHYLCRDIATDPNFPPWRAEALKRGLASCLAIPLVSDGGVLGATCIYSRHADGFDEEAISLLEELASDLAYGIATLRARAERARVMEQLRSSEERSRLLLDSAGEGIYGVDLQGNCTFCNTSSLRLLGYSEASQLLGKHVHDMIHHTPADGMDSAVGENRLLEVCRQNEGGHVVNEVLLRADGTSFPAECRSYPVRRAGEVIGAMETFLDITQRMEAERQMEHLALHDGLTDLPNRVLFRDQINRAIAQSNRTGRPFALLFLDLDRFKNVNDTLGHPTGDMLLREVASRLRATLRETDTIARLGGDEFAILICDFDRADAAAIVGRKVLRQLTEPFRLSGQEVHTTGSLGLTLFPTDATDAESLFRNADLALYQAKRAGRNRLCFFSEEMDREVRDRSVLEADLRRAIDHDELFLLYQPIVSLPGGRPVGVEALARWRHPTQGVIPPGRFIPIAEESGLIVQLGEWAIRRACSQLRAWQDRGAGLRVSVNISAVQVRHEDFLNIIARALADTGADPAGLELELTETILMQDMQSGSRLMSQLREMRIRLSIDDFGTGYSSLNYLHRFPADTLKIDQSFVRDLETGVHDRSIVKSIIDLGHDIGMSVLAEGVETEAQRDYLSRHGCDEAQGFFYSRPVPADEIGNLLRCPKTEFYSEWASYSEPTVSLPITASVRPTHG